MSIAPAPAPAVESVPVATRRVKKSSTSFLTPILMFFGWCWRLVVGIGLCTSYAGSLVAVGWLTRHMQGVTLRSLWKRSRFANDGSFADYLVQFGVDAPTSRPRWFFRERLLAAVSRRGLDGQAPGMFTMMGRWLGAPIHSLWLNIKVGCQSVLGTFLLAGWGCMLMFFSWQFGWHNSFHKGYEIAFLGPSIGIIGLLLFILAMYYVPMAQAHFAFTGEFRAFFDFRFVWKLIRARLFLYTLLISLTGLAVIPVEILTVSPRYFEQINPGFELMTDREFANYYRAYLGWFAAFLFITVLVIRNLAARIYASALVTALERGTVTRPDLNPKIALWLERLSLDVTPTLAEASLGAMVIQGSGWVARRALFTFIFVVWFLVISALYVREFLNYHPYAGFLNQPLVLLPCPGEVPSHLSEK